MALLADIRAARAQGGLPLVAARVARLVYRRAVRPLVPVRGWARYNGVTVAVRTRWTDRFVPEDWSRARDRPLYESALIDGLRRQVAPGDRVVVVGGGWGATAVVAAQQAGAGGHVTVFEGAGVSAERTRWAARRAGVTVDVRHALVATPDHVVAPERLSGPDGGAARVAEIPPCDVLEMDCEGAELGLLRALAGRAPDALPRVILVETHGAWGSATADVRAALGALGYTVLSQHPADATLRAYCAEHDIHVLEAVRPAALPLAP